MCKIEIYTKQTNTFLSMKKTILFLLTTIILFSCGKPDEISDACITSCSPSVPGKINLSIENHTDLNISNFSLTINEEIVPFPLIPKRIQGSYSCWQSFDEIEIISLVSFTVDENEVQEVMVNYENLPNEKEFAIDIRSTGSEFRIQLVEAPDCVSDAD